MKRTYPIQIYKDFAASLNVNESTVDRNVMFNTYSISFNNDYDREYNIFANKMAKILKDGLVGKLIHFRVNSENGKFRNMSLKIREISDVICKKEYSKIFFIDVDKNEFEVPLVQFMQHYYDMDAYMKELLDKFKGKTRFP